VTTSQTAATPAPLFSPSFFTDPYPTYHALRATDPIHWDTRLDAWVLTRYVDVAAAANDARLSRAYTDLEHVRQELSASGRESVSPLYQLLSKMMLFSDPPSHTRLRALANRAFTPRIVDGMRPRIQHVVDELLDAVADHRQLDVIAHLAYPLPVTIIMELLGLPLEERADFKRWSDDVIAFSAGGGDPDRAAHSAQELTHWITRLAAERRRAPREDLLSALVAAEEHGERLSGEELVANMVLLLMNGHETTTFMIANAVRALLLHPDQLHALRDEPDLMGRTSASRPPWRGCRFRSP
jgi:cytochrome P450